MCRGERRGVNTPLGALGLRCTTTQRHVHTCIRLLNGGYRSIRGYRRSQPWFLRPFWLRHMKHGNPAIGEGFAHVSKLTGFETYIIVSR